ncbi:MAG: DUF4215 domain-containing protein [Gemmatimonadota bacterium]
MLTPALALGQGPLPKDQQNCINELNKGFAKVAKKQAKEVCTCIKDGAQGKLGGQTIEECTTADNKGKVADAKQKTISKVADKCSGPTPPFGATDATTVNDAAMAKEILLIHDLFGTDLDQNIISKASDKAAHKCQIDVAKAAKKCQETKLKVFNKCKKDGLKGKVPPGLILSAADLETNCLMTGGDPNTPQPDAKGKIAKACVSKLGGKISKSCSGVIQAAAFPGPCFDAPNLQACLDALVECRVCRALNSADDLKRVCDRFDDGLANKSCPPVSSACGDGILQTLLGEECDDGNTDDGDGCNGVCLDEFCGDGIVNDAPNEACDDGNTVDGDCCSSSCQIESAATECRAASDVCDVAENCDGITPTCPADDVVAAGTECRASSGVCDVAEECDGIGKSCPSDGFEPASIECRASGGVCDVADNCTGSDPNCPADAKSTAECRAATAACDASEVCDGVSNDCPADVLEPASTECRASGGVCDVAESCSGSDPSCPADAFDTGMECRASTGVCDPAESCNGTGTSCPADQLEPPSTECRASAGVCDLAENCSGSDPSCPADASAPDGTSCDDGDACTELDECTSGVCDGGPVCGNGSTEGACGEECDDGNAESFDGCSDICLLEIGPHKCTLDPNASTLALTTALFGIPPLPLLGALDVSCSSVDPNTGKALCGCTIQTIDPVFLTGIGTACVLAGDPNACDLGEIDCDGGNVLDWDLIADHNIGSCTGNPDCGTQCAAHCTGLGAAYSVSDSGCEGFCEGGPSDGLPCTMDTDCVSGSCPGPDGLGQGNICGCQCLAMVGDPSLAGGLNCLIPANIFVVLPSGSPCTDPPTISLGTVCIPATTETATGVVLQANDTPLDSIGPLSGTGVPTDCGDLASSVITGTTMVGQIAFFDSTLGDLTVTTVFACQ